MTIIEINFSSNYFKATMEIIGYLSVPFSVCVIVILYFIFSGKSLKKKEAQQNKYNFVICNSNADIALFVSNAIFIFISIILINATNDLDKLRKIILNVFLIPLNLMCVFAIYLSFRRKITIKWKNITYTPIFGHVKKYTFDDIKCIKTKNILRYDVKYVVIGESGTLFEVTSDLVGFRHFMKRIKENNIEIISDS